LSANLAKVEMERAEPTEHDLMKPLPYALCSVTSRSRSSLFWT